MKKELLTTLLSVYIFLLTFICNGDMFDLTNNTSIVMNTLVGVKTGESEESFIQNQKMKKHRKSIHIEQQGGFRTTTDPIELETPFRMFKSFSPIFTPRSKKLTGILLRAEKDITPADIIKIHQGVDPTPAIIKWTKDAIAIPDVLEKKYCSDNFPKSNIIKETDKKEMVIKIEDLGSWKSFTGDRKSLNCLVKSSDFTIVFSSTILHYRFQFIECKELEGFCRLTALLFLSDLALNKDAEKEFIEMKNEKEAKIKEQQRKIDEGDVL